MKRTRSSLRAPKTTRYEQGLLQFSAEHWQEALKTWEPLQRWNARTGRNLKIKLYVSGFAALANRDYDATLRHWERGLSTPPTISEDAMVRQLHAVVLGIAPLCRQSSTVEPHLQSPTEVAQGARK